MKRRLLLVLSLLVVLSTVLAACASPTPAPTQAPPTSAPATVAPKSTEKPTEVPPTPVPPTPTETPWEAPRGALISHAVAVAPVIDGNASDPIWATAKESVIKVAGAGIKDFDLKMKSIYTADSVYFLVQYPDSNMEASRGAWAYDATTKKWARISDDFGDEDEFGFWWNINAPNWETAGCGQACHGETMVAPKGTTIDSWAFNATRSGPMGWMRDMFVNDDEKADPAGGFNKDEGVKTNKGYADNLQTIGDAEVPLYWKPFSGAGGIITGSPTYLLQAEIDAGLAKKIVSVEKDGTLVDETGAKVPIWAHIPGYILSEPAGPSWNNIAAKGQWANGLWTVELGRKLDTGQADDAQFKDLKATYPFNGYIKTRQPGEAGPHNSIPTTPFVFEPNKPEEITASKVEAPADAPKGALVSFPVKDVPVIDGNATDAAWAEAAQTVIPVVTAGLTDFNVNMKSVYNGDTVYFLVQYPDSNKEASRGTWAYDATQKTWARISDDFGDEDEFGFWWNINMKNFDSAGCGGACHGESMTTPKGETVDAWAWNSTRSNPMGWMRDFFVNDDEKADPAGGFNKDDGVQTNKGYADNTQKIGTKDVPLYWKPFSGAGGVVAGDPTYLLQSEIDAGLAKKIAKVEADGTLVDETGAKVPLWAQIPGYILSAPAGPSWNDIAAKGTWDNGMWTVEFSRKLDTTHADDAQFKDLKATYMFNGYLKTRQTGESGPHNSIMNTPLVFKP